MRGEGLVCAGQAPVERASWEQWTDIRGPATWLSLGSQGPSSWPGLTSSGALQRLPCPLTHYPAGGPWKCPGHLGHRHCPAGLPAAHWLAWSMEASLPAGLNTLWTCVRITWEENCGLECVGTGLAPAPLLSCPLPFFKPLEAASLWPAQTPGLLSICSLLLRRTPAPSRAAEALQSRPAHCSLWVPGGCPEAGLVLKLAGPLWGDGSL